MDIAKLVKDKVEWIKLVLSQAHAKGIVLGMSGGKDSALVGILAKMATENVTGIIMPCESTRNFLEDRDHAILVNDKYSIQTLEVDLTDIKKQFAKLLWELDDSQTPMAYANINPRLRMIALYNYAQRKGYLVAGTGNLSEMTMGYFTKWGDGAFDLNPIADMTATEVYEMLKYLDCPSEVLDKPPSAALYEGQTDEQEMGIKYVDLDRYIRTNEGSSATIEKVERAKKLTAHKRKLGRIYPD